MTKIFAHRGASGQFPENTMLAFEKGIEAGADGIELDVQLTKDGRIVVIHDERLNRTTALKGFVKDTTYDEVKTANAAAGHDQAYSDIKVPLLEDVLSWAVKKDFLNSSVKRDDSTTQEMTQNISSPEPITFEKPALIGSSIRGTDETMHTSEHKKELIKHQDALLYYVELHH